MSDWEIELELMRIVAGIEMKLMPIVSTVVGLVLGQDVSIVSVCDVVHFSSISFMEVILFSRKYPSIAETIILIIEQLIYLSASHIYISVDLQILQQ